LDSLDAEEIKFTPAVELSHLKEDEQRTLACIIETEEVAPSLTQAKQLKQLSQQGELSQEKMTEILTMEKPIDYKVNFKGSDLKQYFPPDTTPKEMRSIIIKLLQEWQQRHSRDIVR
jgi:ParB family chromosome partitioning protein